MFLSRGKARLTVPLALAAVVLLSACLRAEDKPLRQVIDAEIKAAWQREKITPAGRANDAAFLRRIYLDLAGTIPTPDEARQFLEDSAPKKRESLIERLLADPRFANHQADVWDQVFFERNPVDDAARRRDSFKKWLTDKFAKNEPYDRWVRDMLLAEQEGSEFFFVQFRSRPQDATVAVSRMFLGTQLQCARCHDHPFDRWTQRDFYGMAGFFVRLLVIDGGGAGNKRRFFVGEKSTGEVLFSGAAREQRPGRRGEPVKPKFLGGPVLEEPAVPRGFKEPTPGRGQPANPLFSRKEKLAQWLTASDNPYFARAVANRVWAQFMGRGIVDPVDDLGGKNGPSHPALLDALARYLTAHKFDLKDFIRELVSSETYQLASTGPLSDALPKWFERARVRPLSAEELLTTLSAATGHDPVRKPADARLRDAMTPYVVLYFGSPTNGLGDFQGSLAEHLFLNNSYQLRQLIQRRKDNLADAILTSKEPWEKRVDRLFLAVLTRRPKPAERQRFVAYLTTPGGKPEALVEEAIWVLLNCSEFRFNH